MHLRIGTDMNDCFAHLINEAISHSQVNVTMRDRYAYAQDSRDEADQSVHPSSSLQAQISDLVPAEPGTWSMH